MAVGTESRIETGMGTGIGVGSGSGGAGCSGSGPCEPDPTRHSPRGERCRPECPGTGRESLHPHRAMRGQDRFSAVPVGRGSIDPCELM